MLDDSLGFVAILEDIHGYPIMTWILIAELIMNDCSLSRFVSNLSVFFILESTANQILHSVEFHRWMNPLMSCEGWDMMISSHFSGMNFFYPSSHNNGSETWFPTNGVVSFHLG